MSYTFSLAGNSSLLEQHIYPGISLDAGRWELGLLSFDTYNSIPNVPPGTVLYYDSNSANRQKIVIPQGSYEIEDISKYISKVLGSKTSFILIGNRNTLRTSVFCDVDVYLGSSLASLLGFERQTLESGQWHVSESPPNISPVTSIRISCNISHGAYLNGHKTNIIYELPINVPAGYRLLERPPSPIYYEVNTRDITTISISLSDQMGMPINNRAEFYSLQLHLRRQRE